MLPLLHSATLTVDGLDQLSNAADSPVAAIGALTGLAAVILLFGMPVIIIWLNHVYRERRRRMQHEVVMKLAEKGQPVPPELFLEPQQLQKKKSDLSSGLTLVCIGVGVAVGFYFNGNTDMVGWALIPFFIGLARLIAWKLEQGQKGV
jgi:hypothetical protein